ncbi:hypothetical protein CRH11_14345 [Bacillus velezensis]|nr:hypothetical protein CG798_14615 [Bacillus velezensis]ATO11103.1 hypothetical protein CRH11_14345 [Bacillus velezensis]
MVFPSEIIKFILIDTWGSKDGPFLSSGTQTILQTNSSSGFITEEISALDKRCKKDSLFK